MPGAIVEDEVFSVFPVLEKAGEIVPLKAQDF